MSNATLAAPSEAILNARDELASFESGASAVSWGTILAEWLRRLRLGVRSRRRIDAVAVTD
jgi:hypothetical protein